MRSSMDKTVGQRLAYWLRERSMSQTELARRIGVDPSTVSDWVTGVRIPLLSNLQKVVKELRLTLGGFFAVLLDDNPSSPPNGE